MAYVNKIHLKNFKRFQNFEANLLQSTNLFIGDNESGKSTILTAIDLVLSTSKSKIEAIGLESLFNKKAIKEFLSLDEADKTLNKLPSMQIDIYIKSQEEDPDFEGNNNLKTVMDYGVKLVCEPNMDFSEFIANSLKESNFFPFEFYTITFSTFAGSSYSKYKNPINYVLLDHSNVNGEYATNEYVKKVYGSLVEDKNRIVLRNHFNHQKEQFNTQHLVNHTNEKYRFALRGGARFALENNITIVESDVPLEHRGKGKQCFIKAEFVLNKANRSKTIDLVMLEEPENHLSHSNMKKLLDIIKGSEDKQIIVTTHNNLIASRLDLRNSILLNSNTEQTLSLKTLDPDTADFFTKAPNNNVLQYTLSSKVILVEGDAEYILIDEFFKIHKKISTDECNIHIISVGGLSFKRYLDITKTLGIKTAVITDNDKDYQKNITEKYLDYNEIEEIKIFSDIDNMLSTFEICLYLNNKNILDNLINKNNNIKCVQNHMLNNKSSSALKILNALNSDSSFQTSFSIPKYIRDAIEWISE